jgi:predicted transcriptional regulator
MVEEFEKVRKAENRTKSELVREALRQYFSGRFPAVSASKAELAAIKRGRAAFARGEYVSLDEPIHDVEPGRYQARPKGSRRPSRKGKRAD